MKTMTPQDWRNLSERTERLAFPAGPGLGTPPEGVLLCVCDSRVHSSAWQREREARP